jgi:hypothetical protein
MKKIVVLRTSGKHDSVYYATVVLFDAIKEADQYIAEVTTPIGSKHWVQAEIVLEKEEVELCSPE